MPKKKGLSSRLILLLYPLSIRFASFSALRIDGRDRVRVSNTLPNKLTLKAMQGGLYFLVRATVVVGAAGPEKCVS